MLQQELWVNARNRLDVGFRVGQDLTDEKTELLFFLVWNFSNGRRYRDHAPGTLSFRQLRDSRIPEQYRNTIEVR